jgi:hypothetical protein
MDKDARLDALFDAVAARRAAENSVSEAAISARMAGATWEEIGVILGLTKQGAHRRYATALPYDFPASA